MITATDMRTTFSQLESYRDLDRQIKALTKERDAIKRELTCGYFLDHDDFIFEGRLLATYKPHIQITFDKKCFQSENPDLYEKYLEPKEIRKFLLK